MSSTQEKGSKSGSDNYRPISVISVIARVFEKLIHEQLFLQKPIRIWAYRSTQPS